MLFDRTILVIGLTGHSVILVIGLTAHSVILVIWVDSSQCYLTELYLLLG